MRSPSTRTAAARRASGWPRWPTPPNAHRGRGREAAENELSAALALVDPASLPLALVAELADAEARVLLARRFHNDAVRDTLALRERPAVRMLRLGGTAALPTYFEIAERAERRASDEVGRGQPARRRRASCCSTTTGRCCCSAGPTRPPSRTAARRGGGSPSAGRSQPGETLAEAAARELEEETGLRVSPPTDRSGVAARRGHRLQRRR